MEPYISFAENRLFCQASLALDPVSMALAIGVVVALNRGLILELIKSISTVRGRSGKDEFRIDFKDDPPPKAKG